LDFHVGDKVVVLSPGRTELIRFAVSGVNRDGTGKLLYCGPGTPWYPEEALDYDMTEAQRDAVVPAEQTIHALSVLAEDLGKLVEKARTEFYGEVPLVLMEELTRVRRVLRKITEPKFPGALERADLVRLLAAARVLNLEYTRLHFAPNPQFVAAFQALMQAAEDVESML